MRSVSSQTLVVRSRSRRTTPIRLDKILFDSVFILPALLIFSIFFLLPVLSSFYYSLTNWNGLSPDAQWVGLDNFTRLLDDREVWKALLTTITFAITVTVVQNVLGLLLALALDGRAFMLRVLRVVFLIPALLSPLAVGNIWNYIYEPNIGVLNTALTTLGLGSMTHDWLGDPKLALASTIIAHIWQWVGISMIIYMAGLQNISGEVQEAATIDGVNARTRFWGITFPLLAPSVTINVVLAMIGTIKVFDIIYVMTRGGPGGATDTLSTLIYQKAFNFNQFGYGTTIAVVMFFFILLLSIVQLRVLQRREVN